MPRVEFEPTIPVCKRAKTFHAVDSAANESGFLDLNYLNTELQVRQKLIFDTFEAVGYFEMKLKLFWQELENGDLWRIYLPVNCFIKMGQYVFLPSVRAQEIIVLLPENF
jgi:hypothetical protein